MAWRTFNTHNNMEHGLKLDVEISIDLLLLKARPLIRSCRPQTINKPFVITNSNFNFMYMLFNCSDSDVWSAVIYFPVITKGSEIRNPQKTGERIKSNCFLPFHINLHGILIERIECLLCVYLAAKFRVNWHLFLFSSLLVVYCGYFSLQQMNVQTVQCVFFWNKPHQTKPNHSVATNNNTVWGWSNIQ